MQTTDEDTSALAADLAAFRAALVPHGDALRLDGWTVAAGEMPFSDFNREVVPPGTNPKYPEGAVGIRMDWDFWTAAVLPYRFVGLDCMTIVRTLWPDVEDPTVWPDHGDPWWAAKTDEGAEVPGEPFELWSTVTPPEGEPERQRMDTFPDRAAALAAEPRSTWHMGPGYRVECEIMEWRAGERLSVETFPASNVRVSPEG